MYENTIPYALKSQRELADWMADDLANSLALNPRTVQAYNRLCHFLRMVEVVESMRRKELDNAPLLAPID